MDLRINTNPTQGHSDYSLESTSRGEETPISSHHEKATDVTESNLQEISIKVASATGQQSLFPHSEDKKPNNRVTKKESPKKEREGAANASHGSDSMPHLHLDKVDSRGSNIFRRFSSRLPSISSPKDSLPSPKIVLPSKKFVGLLMRNVPPELQTMVFHRLKFKKLIVLNSEKLTKVEVHFSSNHQPLLEVMTFEDPKMISSSEEMIFTGDVDPSFGLLQKLKREEKPLLLKIGSAFINNYPLFAQGAQINCDAFHAEVHPEYVFSIMADGCSWGPRPREAAQRAVAAATNHINSILAESCGMMKNAEDIACLLVQALAAAHEAILTNKKSVGDVGTTTLNICFAFTNPKGIKYLIVVGLGDCKVLLATNYQEKQYKVFSIEGAQRLTADARDPGGRLGPYVGPYEIDPDLRNLSINCIALPPAGDCLILNMTDGVHDNFSPEFLGKEPRDFDSAIEPFKKWGDLHFDKRLALCASYQNEMLSLLINEVFSKNQGCSLSEVCERITFHCHQVTSKGREYMQTHPKEKEPQDWKVNPGKMDHCSIVAFRF